jgi:hypothetical protein
MAAYISEELIYAGTKLPMCSKLLDDYFTLVWRQEGSKEFLVNYEPFLEFMRRVSSIEEF